VQELEALLERTLRLVVNRLLSDDRDGANWVLVDAAPVTLTVDGRGVTDPVGFRGREIGATVFAALTRAEAIAAWGLVAQDLEFSSLTLAATPLALASGLPVSQGILVDVGGGTTDLIWCRAGRPVMLNSLPTGGGALTGLLLRTWHLSPERAERLKLAYSSGRMAAELGTQVLEVLSPGLQDWLEETEVAMARLNQEGLLPQHLYVLGGGSALPEVTEAVRSLAWSRRLQFARYPQVGHLRPTDVPGVVNRTSLGRELGDVSALALAAWAAQQQQPTDRPALILSELCQE
jgi:cell division protein FtsA